MRAYHVLSPTVAAPLRAFAFVRDCWSMLSPRDYYYAALAGGSLAVVQGTGYAIFGRNEWWRGFLAMFIPTLLQAILLLLCLTIAARVATTRVPQWVPFVAAAVVATMLTYAFDVLVVDPLFGTPSVRSSAQWLAAAWFNVPTYLLIGILAALAYMHLIDAERRLRVLRKVQLERTRMAHEAYKSRLKSLQARVEPAFLFDTLARIEVLYEASPKRGERVLDDLIVYLRAALPSAQDDASTLSAELTLARAWLDIMQSREGACRSYAIAGLEPHQDARIPPMVVLPLVQQAFVSGTGTAREGPVVGLAAQVTGARVRVLVTAARPTFAAAGATPAIAAIRERLDALYGTRASLDLRVVDDDVSEAVLEIPHAPVNSDPGIMARAPRAQAKS